MHGYIDRVLEDAAAAGRRKHNEVQQAYDDLVAGGVSGVLRKAQKQRMRALELDPRLALTRRGGGGGGRQQTQAAAGVGGGSGARDTSAGGAQPRPSMTSEEIFAFE